MRLAIPHAPRPVRLSQVPGAVTRLARTVLASLAILLAVAAVSYWLSGFLIAERAFLSRAVPVDGKVLALSLPPRAEREGKDARLEVLFTLNEREFSASGVAMPAVIAEGLGRGAVVALLVDPADPHHPRQADAARSSAGRWGLLPFGLGLGALVALLLIGRELRRTLRSEVEPLRLGALVWLTPDGPLPETRDEIVFPASYLREDKRLTVRARARPGRAPVRNGEKVLGAVVPHEPTWVRVVDEDLARTLGWYA